VTATIATYGPHGCYVAAVHDDQATILRACFEPQVVPVAALVFPEKQQKKLTEPDALVMELHQLERLRGVEREIDQIVEACGQLRMKWGRDAA